MDFCDIFVLYNKTHNRHKNKKIDKKIDKEKEVPSKLSHILFIKCLAEELIWPEKRSNWVDGTDNVGGVSSSHTPVFDLPKHKAAKSLSRSARKACRLKRGNYLEMQRGQQGQ